MIMFNEIMKDAIKVQIKHHPDYCWKFHGVEIIMSDSENNREEIISALKETVDQSIQRSVVIISKNNYFVKDCSSL